MVTCWRYFFFFFFCRLPSQRPLFNSTCSSCEFWLTCTTPFLSHAARCNRERKQGGGARARWIWKNLREPCESVLTLWFDMNYHLNQVVCQKVYPCNSRVPSWPYEKLPEKNRVLYILPVSVWVSFGFPGFLPCCYWKHGLAMLNCL